MRKFYDTCSLLLKAGELFEQDEKIIISSVTLNELENIKTASNKDADVKYAARKLLQTLLQHPTEYDVVVFKEAMLKPFQEEDLSITNDIKILACAYDYKQSHCPDLHFVTNDMALSCIAALFFDKDHLDRIDEEDADAYTGYLEVILDEDEMAEFYQNPTDNRFNLYINQYLIVRDTDNNIVDKLCWTGDGYRPLAYDSFKSRDFGVVKALPGDPYQAMLADSLMNNTITMVKGPAGAGKTYLSLAYLMAQLERGKISKIVIFCNTVATKNSAKLGFYPGTRDEKLLDSQIGNLLISKFGDRLAVEQMIDRGTLVLLPMSDIRGYDTSGMNAGIYISEAQNTDISLMKLALQRIGNDAICIIDGDCRAQVDAVDFAGASNGMRRASKVFRGEDIYGEVELKVIHRSQIATIAQRM